MKKILVGARIDPELKESLDRLSRVTRRSLARIVREALQNYVERNAWQIVGGNVRGDWGESAGGMGWKYWK